MRLAFAGSGAFGIPCLEALATSRHSVVLTISQPDRPVGRRRTPTPPPAAGVARRLGLDLFQPERLNAQASRERLLGLELDALVVIAYGQLLKPSVLEIPRLGAVNVHGSLLPRHRGASPIVASLLAGDEATGVTVIQMDAGLDSGPILGFRETTITPHENAGELHDRLAALAPPLLLGVLDALDLGTANARPQDDALATRCGLIQKADGVLDWTLPAVDLDRRIRGFTPWPGAQTILTRARGGELHLLVERARPETGSGPPGEVLEAVGERFVVGTGSGVLALERIRPAGKGSQSAGDFLRGYHARPTDRFSMPS